MKALFEVIELEVKDIVTASAVCSKQGQLVDECEPDYE